MFSARILRMTSKPFVPGIIRSSTIIAGRFDARARERVLAARGLGGREAGAPQLARDELARRRVVVDDEDVAACRARCSG